MSPTSRGYLRAVVLLAFGSLATALASQAQSPAIVMEDYTSDVAVATAGNVTLLQQTGSPLMIPDAIEGDAQLFQGLYSIVSGVSSSSSGIESVFIDSDAVEIAYQPAAKTLTVTGDESIGKCRLCIVDLDGKVIANEAVNAPRTDIDLSILPAGTYAAGILYSNSYLKTLKFIVK